METPSVGGTDAGTSTQDADGADAIEDDGAGTVTLDGSGGDEADGLSPAGEVDTVEGAACGPEGPPVAGLEASAGDAALGAWCGQGTPVQGFPCAGEAAPEGTTIGFPAFGASRSFWIKRMPRFVNDQLGYRLPVVWDPAGVPQPWEAVGYPDYDSGPELETFGDILHTGLAVDQPYVGYVNVAWGGKFIHCDGHQASDWSRVQRDGSLPTFEEETDEGTLVIEGAPHWSRAAYQTCFIASLVAGAQAGVNHWMLDDPFVNVPSSYHAENLSGFNTWLEANLSPDEVSEGLGIDLATFSYAEHSCQDDADWCPVERLWEIFQILEMKAFLTELRTALVETAASIGAPTPMIGLNLQSSAHHLEYATTVQDIGMSEIPGIVYRNNSHLPFYRLFESMGRGLFPIKPPLMYLHRVEGQEPSVTLTPENRIATSEVLMSDALSFVFPGRYTRAPYTNEHFESDEDDVLLHQVDAQVRPVYWTSQHYCGAFEGERHTSALLLWSMASEPSPAGTRLTDQYISSFNAVGQALDRSHIPYRALAIGDRFLTAQGPLEATDLEGVSLVVLPRARSLSMATKSLLVSFVRDGGQVLAVGRAGYSNFLGATLADADQPEGWTALFGAESGQVTDGGVATTMAMPAEPCSAEEARWLVEEEQDSHRVCPGLRDAVVETLTGQLDLTAVRPVQADLPDGVVLDTVRASDGSLVIKLHNRNFDDTTVLPASGSLTVPLAMVPEDPQVSWFKAGHYAEPLQSEVSDGALAITIPVFSDFALVRIGSPIRYRHFDHAPVSWLSDQDQ